MFGKKKKPSVDEAFESVTGETFSSFCKGDSFMVTRLRNGILSDNNSQINYALKQLDKDDSRTRHIINQVIVRLLGT